MSDTDLALPASTDDPLAVPGATDGCHALFVCVVNNEHEPTTFRCKHTNLTVVPRYKRVKFIGFFFFYKDVCDIA